jgi:hypothetical protein
MYCNCKEPRKSTSYVGKSVFEVCSKNLGGCGKEIAITLYTAHLKNLTANPFNLPQKSKCEFGCCQKEGEFRRQNTQYELERSNWGYFCEEHQEEVDAHWEDMWKDYWSSRL